MKFNDTVANILTEASKRELNYDEMSVPLTPEQEDKFRLRLKGSKFQIYKHAPFLGHFLQKLNVVTTYSLPTMAVDTQGNIYINPRFALEFLDFDECIGVLAHEASHIATMTSDRKKGRHHQLWNIATDFIMNRDLLRNGFKLPSAGCIPVMSNNGATAKVVLNSKLTASGKAVSIDVSNKSAEYLYKILDKQMKFNAVAPLDIVLGTPGKTNDGTPIVIVDGEIGNKSADDIRRAVSQASQSSKNDEDAGRGKQRGTGEGGMREHIMDIHKPRVDWRVVLKQIIVQTVARYDQRKFAKRPLAAGVILPKMHNEDILPPIVIAIDTSGSIGQQELSAFVTETLNVFRHYPQANICIVLWHDVAYYHINVTKGTAPTLLQTILNNLRSGGTTMGSVAEYLRKNKLEKQATAVVYITDGFVEHPPINLLPPPTKNFALVTTAEGIKTLQPETRLKTFLIDIK